MKLIYMFDFVQICEIDPGFFRDSDSLVRNWQGRLEILAVSVHAEGDTHVDNYDDHEDLPSHLPKESADSMPSHLSKESADSMPSHLSKESADSMTSRLPKESTDSVLQLTEKMKKQTISSGNGNTEGEVKQNKCSTCNAFVGDSKQFREHFKSDWHKHNLKRKTRQLPPLTAEECLADMELDDSKADLKDYSF
ncbi:hypothetical protein SLEP1_g33104 [Rubroshorea leprosula]|uniref:U1-type domain-containing protein n=1 Tax=Rubroshorea leprosula TaxID=152421 RepID=A0AAV5KFL3_9ROSI|nr:hypothetical protein SLEP1_g33104 [Rubroshorea leprosula]